MYEDDEHIFLVLPFMEHGQLLDALRRRRDQCYKESDAVGILQQLLLSMDFLHKKGIVHRDLKPSNILLTEVEGFLKCVIADFGLSVFSSEKTKLKDKLGSPGYTSPEIFLDRSGYGAKVDIFSLGCIYYLILVGAHLFHDFTAEKCLHKNLACDFREAKRLLREAGVS